MKKFVFMLATILMLAVSSICSASPGKVLDSEIAIIEKYVSAPNYKAVEPMLAAEFKKEFNETTFANFKKAFGNSTKKKLLAINKYDDGDAVVYMMAFEKVPAVMFQFVFEVTNEKPLLAGTSFELPPKAEPAAQQGK